VQSNPSKTAYYSEAEALLVAVDCIIFGFDLQHLKLLLFRRKVEPFRGEWSLIGSFVNPGESISDAAVRVLAEYTGLQDVYMDQLGGYGETDRDPGARVISLAYYALIRINEQDEKLAEKYDAHWFDYNDLPPLILDHEQMVADALETLRRKARNQPIGFELLPEKFTIPQLLSLYTAIYQQPIDRRNFRKRILSLGIIEKLDEKDKTGSRKGAYLYRFDQEKYREMVEVGGGISVF